MQNRRGSRSRRHCPFGVTILFTRVIVVDVSTSTIIMISIHDPFTILTNC